jgi:septum formation protein
MLILASISPRRKELLESVGFKFNLKKPNFDEDTIDASKMKVDEYVLHLAESKSKSVFSNYPNDIVIAADTIVVLGHDIIGKPKDETDAMNILRRLSGKTHQVYTGVFIVSNNQEVGFVEVANVTFKSMSEEDILAYIATKEPMDKAGAYGIQGYGSQYVEGYDGDFHTIMGLPLKKVISVLKGFGVTPESAE